MEPKDGIEPSTYPLPRCSKPAPFRIRKWDGGFLGPTYFNFWQWKFRRLKAAWCGQGVQAVVQDILRHATEEPEGALVTSEQSSQSLGVGELEIPGPRVAQLNVKPLTRRSAAFCTHPSPPAPVCPAGVSKRTVTLSSSTQRAGHGPQGRPPDDCCDGAHGLRPIRLSGSGIGAAAPRAGPKTLKEARAVLERLKERG
jgi:hypothetical protein